MIIVGLTGGIGSGKTTVANLFNEQYGIPVYIADIEAKLLMNRSKVIRRKLIELFGNEAYLNGVLNRPFLASKIFKNKDLLKQMNAIVHPKVASHFRRWLKRQEAPYVIKEVAILFENGSHTSCDLIITVTAPRLIRIDRVITRDNSSQQKVKLIMDNQWEDDKKVKLSDFVINNENLEETKRQVRKVHKKILTKIQ